ncbi:MAG: hypothetical protein IJ709_10330 [Selenomonas sp.]|nr:hypothetical protein [Selenomonas sp.]
MGFAKKMQRKLKKKAQKGDKNAIREYNIANAAVKESYVMQLKRDRNCRKEAIHNLTASFLLAMHEGYGFGAGRLKRLQQKMQSEFDAITAKNVSIEEVAEFLRDEIGLDVDIAASDPNAGHYRKIEFKAVQEMSAAFLMAMLDEFNFKKKRLGAAYDYVAALSEKANAGEITYDEITQKVNEVMCRGEMDKTRFKAITHKERKMSA